MLDRIEYFKSNLYHSTRYERGYAFDCYIIIHNNNLILNSELSIILGILNWLLIVLLRDMMDITEALCRVPSRHNASVMPLSRTWIMVSWTMTRVDVCCKDCLWRHHIDDSVVTESKVRFSAVTIDKREKECLRRYTYTFQLFSLVWDWKY